MSPFAFHLLPSRHGGAAENMALDFLLLQRYPDSDAARFRHYDWHRPAFTFGYSQKIEFVRSQLPAGETFDLCRRPTGGGVVDHRDDWTYSLVLPRGHPLEELRATQSYRLVHEALAGALARQHVPAVVKPCPESPTENTGASAAGVCFERAEIFDVVHGSTGQKIAGAAQKRNKHGLLFQGSIWKPAVASTEANAIDWEIFQDNFIAQLATTLSSPATPVPWPELNEDEVSALTEQYSSPEWLAHR